MMERSAHKNLKTWEEVKIGFRRLPETKRAIALTLVAFHVTVLARSVYPNQTSKLEETADKLSSLNEIEHTLLGQVASLLRDVVNRYPDDGLIDIISDKSRISGFDSEVRETFKKALSEAVDPI